MHKSELRNIIRNLKRQFTQAQLDELSLGVISKLKQHPRFSHARTLLLYYSLPDEVNTHILINEIKDKTILLPRVINGEDMEIRTYTGSGDMQEGSFHIMEPIGKVFTNYSDIDVAVVPGMAFDNSGHRLGRGKGYYDRFLCKVPDTYKIGICFKFQKLTDIPTEQTDVSMDEVIS